MPAQPTDHRTEPAVQTERCYKCFRPKVDCFCESIPRIDNRTDVLILQHMRERFHPFNTARIVHRALVNSSLLVDRTDRLAVASLPLKPRAGLLYPGPGAALISDLPPDKRPEQLVILDGTWSQAKTLARDIRALHDLPRYELLPSSPGRYRIRREPSDTTLSTLEATVAALKALEPNTVGLDQLLETFHAMVDRQLTYPKGLLGRRRKPARTLRNIPRTLVHDLEHVVVAYGESTARKRGSKRGPRSPIYWVAQRLGSGERFTCALEPDAPLADSLLAHLELTDRDFADALSPSQFQAAWKAFLRPDDTLAVYSQSTARLLERIGGDRADCLVLKSVSLGPQQHGGTLAEVLAAAGLVNSPPQHPGRAGKRLANAVTWAQHLNALGRAAFSEREA